MQLLKFYCRHCYYCSFTFVSLAIYTTAILFAFSIHFNSPNNLRYTLLFYIQFFSSCVFYCYIVHDIVYFPCSLSAKIPQHLSVLLPSLFLHTFDPWPSVAELSPFAPGSRLLKSRSQIWLLLSAPAEIVLRHLTQILSFNSEIFTKC